MSNDNENNVDVGQERVVLFVKGPYFKDDKQCRFAADIFSHRFMFIMHEKNISNRSITALDLTFKKDILQGYGINSTANLPCLVHDVFQGYKEVVKATGERQVVAEYEKVWEDDDPGKIETYLEDRFQPKLCTTNTQAYKVQLDVFHKFILYLKTKNGDPREASKMRTLVEELRKIDAFLTGQGTKFLTGDSIRLPDCQLLPKLYQIRVGGKHYKQFEIPDGLSALGRYMEAGDLEEGFRQTMPSDKEVIKVLEKYPPSSK